MLGARLNGDAFKHYLKAGSQSCSPELLEAMAHSEIDRIRVRVAENPRTPIDVLEILAMDKNVDVRVAVGTNPSTPPYLSYKLASDDEPNVRLGLAEDVNTPVEILDKLADDANPYVSHLAMQTRAIVMSQGKPRTFGRRFVRWFKNGGPELRFA
ncbi:MAG TPA: hypothetical protein V6C81_06880 [Planktothrix sp.]|jgi:hypothetical protein